MIESFRHKGLRRFYENDDRKHLPPELVEHIREISTALAAAESKVAILLNNLALLLQDTNRRSGAEPLLRRALAIDEKSYDPDHPAVATDLNNLAGLLHVTNRLSRCFRRDGRHFLRPAK